MIISVINEPRSGSYALVKWLAYKTDDYEYSKLFTLRRGRLRNTSEKDPSVKYNLNYDTKYLITSFVHQPGDDYGDLINFSNKMIFLYRENEKEQTESFVSMMKTGISNSQYTYVEYNDDEAQRYVEYLKILKIDFKEKYLNNSLYFSISYEDLFIGNGINKIIEYLDIPEIKDSIGFPYGIRYRQFGDDEGNKMHII